MANGAVEALGMDDIAETLAGFARVEGSCAHAYAATAHISASADGARNLADAVHYLCTLHGRHPGLVDMAADRNEDPAFFGWLAEAVPAFALERAYLTRLVVAVGPLPSTPNQAACETTIIGQRHALEMIGASERRGCAIGAALGLALDWPLIRRVLDAAAARFGLPLERCEVPDPASLGTSITSAPAPAIARAIAFGARQVFTQHQGLWDLLEARAQARRALI